MLEEELDRLRGVENRLTEVAYDQGGSIPAFYIPQEGVRVTLYRRLLQVVGLDELMALMGEMEDRFGPLPEPVRLLTGLTAIRNCGAAFGLRTVSVRKGGTSAEGKLDGLAPFLKKKRGWTILGAHAVGPGGVPGASGLFEAMREAAEAGERSSSPGE